MMEDEAGKVKQEINEHILAAMERYGGFASTHEALGVALEEFDELKEAVRLNRLESVREEAIDLAAVLIRLAASIRVNDAFQKRSVK